MLKYMNQPSVINQIDPLVSNKKTYKSMFGIGLIVWNIALSSFYFGYSIVYLGSLQIQTLKRLFGITLSDSVAQGLLNGCIPIGSFKQLHSDLQIFKKVIHSQLRKCLLIINFFAFMVGGLISFLNDFQSLSSAIAPLIIKQLSPNQISGTLGAFVQLNIALGVFIGLFFTYLLKKITGDLSGSQFWYFVFGLTQITILVQTIILLFIFPYETPKYLLLIGEEEQAKKLISIIYKEEFVQAILKQKKADIISAVKKIQVQFERSSSNNPITIVVALHLSVLQQFCGINAIAEYGGIIASQATSGQLQLLIPSLINFQQVLTCAFTSYLLTKFERKTMLQLGTLLETIACGLIMIGFLIKEQQQYVGQIFVLIGLFMFMAVFGLSLGPVVWLYILEIVQPKIVPYSTAGDWISASIVIILFPIITQSVLNGNPGYLFIFFTTWCVFSLIFNHFFLIETKDKTQKVIGEEYDKIRLC